MRNLVLAVLMVSGLAVPAAAQGDTAGRHREELRRRIEDRFDRRVQEQLGLTDDQAAKLRAATREHAGRRRALEARERDLRGALSGQLRPGVAADQDSVARLTRELLDLRVAYAESWREEMADLGFLSPVQRAQLYVMRDRLLQRVREVHQERGGWRRRRGVP